MGLNNKGFAISTILYSLLVMATLIIFLLIGNFSFERRTTSNLVTNIESGLNDFAKSHHFNPDSNPDEPSSLSEILLTYVGNNGGYYDDGTDTFITGENPNNYIWYSGKLWRAVSVNNEEKTTKLVTQDNISSISFDDNSNTFSGSNIEMWLNDTSADGFLGNLRNPESFIKMDSKWNATASSGVSSGLDNTTIVEDAVGLLSIYEYDRTNNLSGYLDNQLDWWTITPLANDTTAVYSVSYYRSGSGVIYSYDTKTAKGVRPAINIKADINIASGSGTEEDPYRLEGDNDEDISGTKLNTRYSGEYIKFGTKENVLYRIVSHETENLTKVTSANTLNYRSIFGTSPTFATSTVYTFLNAYAYYENYLTNDEVNMIEDSTTWYLGTVDNGANYRLAKYNDIDMTSLTTNTINAKVGLLRVGELMCSQQNTSYSSYLENGYWLLTPAALDSIYYINGYGNIDTINFRSSGGSETLLVKPTFNLKENVIITGGDGTLQNPFTVALS